MRNLAIAAAMLTMAACGQPAPHGDYQGVTWTAIGDCGAFPAPDMLRVGDDLLTWWFSEQPGLQFSEYGSADGECFNVEQNSADWKAYSLCSDSNERISGQRERVDGTCTLMISATR